MKENNIIQFPTPIKKAENFAGDRINEDQDFLKILTREEQNEFTIKWVEVVEMLHKLKQSDPHAIKKENVQIRKEDLICGSSPEWLRDRIMEADELKIKKDPSYYEALTDEIYERKLNKPKI